MKVLINACNSISIFSLAVGSVPSPFDCYLANRGLKTLHLRMRQHAANAFAVAKFLEKDERCEKVLYPGLEAHPQHELAKQQMTGFGGMVTFYIKGGLEQAKEFLKKVKASTIYLVFTLAESLGGFESLCELPSIMTHASVPPDQRIVLGISDNMIRLSVGLEDTQDIIDDVDQALAAAVMNVEVVARIRPPSRGEITSLNVSGTRIETANGTGHIFDAVYKPHVLTYDIYKDSFSTYVDFFVAGYNVCVLVFGETDSGKSYSLAGRKLDLTEDPVVGVDVKNITKKQVSDAAECTALFRQALESTTHSKTDYGQADTRSAMLFILDLIKVHKDTPEPFHSRLMVVKLPGAEKLAEDPTQLRMREGPTLNRSILAFRQVVSSLAASPMVTRVINYNDSKLTMLLKDALGGNCKTKVLVTLKATETATLSTVLTMSGQLAQILNYPIVNDHLAQHQLIHWIRIYPVDSAIHLLYNQGQVSVIYLQGGQSVYLLGNQSVCLSVCLSVSQFICKANLISQYRAIIFHLQDDLRHSGRNPGDARDSKVQEMKDQLAKITNENAKLQEGREQLYRRIIELEAKYTEATTSWKQLSSKLELSDEEKLQIYKNLVDLQLENNKLIEEAAADKYELTNRILSLENQVSELDTVLERDRRAGEQANFALDELQREHKELGDEYLVLKTNHMQISNQHQQEVVSKNEELGLELVHLSSIKDRLKKDKESVEIETMQEYYSQLRKLASKFSRSSLQEKVSRLSIVVVIVIPIIITIPPLSASSFSTFSSNSYSITSPSFFSSSSNCSSSSSPSSSSPSSSSPSSSSSSSSSPSSSSPSSSSPSSPSPSSSSSPSFTFDMFSVYPWFFAILVTSFDSLQNDMSKSLVSLRSENLQLEKQLLMSSHAKEGMADALKNEYRKELSKLEDNIHGLKINVKQLQASQRDSQRKLAGQSAELIMSQADKRRLEEQNNKIDQQLKEVSVEYSNRLQQYIHDISVYCGQMSGQQVSLESLHAYIDAMVRKVRDAQEHRVVTLEERVKALKDSLREVTSKHGKLLSAYSVLRYDLETTKGSHMQYDGDYLYQPTQEELDNAQTQEIRKLTTKMYKYEQDIEDLKKQLSTATAKLVNLKDVSPIKTARTEDKQSVFDSSSEVNWNQLRKLLREFTLNTQQDLESERASLMTRCVIAEEQVSGLQEYIDTRLRKYLDEIARLRKRLGESDRVNSADAAINSYGRLNDTRWRR
ncbi:hypothetical protein QZH41_012250 [Actinostola sp. cb2023]|nr:hypothetical protein QZH41_012250 [Actinostola sp. cb2023]